MNKEQFLEKLIDLLQCEVEITEDTELLTLAEWDSLSKMALQTFFKRNFSKELTYDQLAGFKYVRDIFEAAGVVE